MGDFDLDPLIAGAAARIVRGEVADDEKFTVEVGAFYTVSWTGVAGVTQVRRVPDPPVWDYTTQARDFACILTDGRVASPR